MSTELVTLSKDELTLAGTLDSLAESGLTCRDMKQGFAKAMTTASCISRLKQALTPAAMKPIIDLQGSSLGFRTDKDTSGGYPENVVKEALISAVMVGLMPSANHFNIIAGRMYVTKEGFTYLLDQAGVKYTIDQAVPVMKNGGAVVATDITWTYDGKDGKKHLEIPVRVNQGMGADAILGKADRKAKCWLYNNLLHAQLSDGDAESSEPAAMRNVTPASHAGAAPLRPAPVKPESAPVPDSAEVLNTMEDFTAQKTALHVEATQRALLDREAVDAAVQEFKKTSTPNICETAMQSESNAVPPVVVTEAEPKHSGAFARLKSDLADAGRSWTGLRQWLKGKSVQLPEIGASPEEYDRFAAWLYAQPSLVTDMVNSTWIVRSTV